MPAKSKEQQRLFGMVHAYQKGELKDASEEVKDIAKTISKKDAKDFAETKHKGLPNKVKKSVKETVKINESQLRKIIAESVKKALREEEQFVADNSMDFIYEFNDAAGKFEGELREYLERYPDEALSAFYGNAVFKDLNALRNSISEFYQATYEA